jgi:hypothetical protein
MNDRRGMLGARSEPASGNWSIKKLPTLKPFDQRVAWAGSLTRTRVCVCDVRVYKDVNI